MKFHQLTITIFEMFVLDFKCQHCQLLQLVVCIGFEPSEAVTAVNSLTGDRKHFDAGQVIPD